MHCIYAQITYQGSTSSIAWWPRARKFFSQAQCLIHWGRVTHICVSNLTIIGSDNGLLPGRRQAIIWTNTGILLIGPLRTNFSEISIEILTFSIKKMRFKVSSAKMAAILSRPQCVKNKLLTEPPRNLQKIYLFNILSFYRPRGRFH